VFGIPLNRYTKKLANLMPSWFSSRLIEILQSRKENEEENHD